MAQRHISRWSLNRRRSSIAGAALLCRADTRRELPSSERPFSSFARSRRSFPFPWLAARASSPPASAPSLASPDLAGLSSSMAGRGHELPSGGQAMVFGDALGQVFRDGEPPPRSRRASVTSTSAPREHEANAVGCRARRKKPAAADERGPYSGGRRSLLRRAQLQHPDLLRSFAPS
jgi:hypothetical protein